MDLPNAPQPKRLALQPEWRENRVSSVGVTSPLSPAGLPQKATMEQSPLTQDVRPDVFEPKVVGLYRNLFRVCLVLSRSVAICLIKVEPRRPTTMREQKAIGRNCFS